SKTDGFERPRSDQLFTARGYCGRVRFYRDGLSLARRPSRIIMLDNANKTAKLVISLKAAVPFEVELTPEVIDILRTQQPAIIIKPQQVVSQISYAGDEGGIMCRIHPKELKNAIIISITHVRMDRKQPLGAGVFDYQKERVKNLEKQNGRA